MPAMGLQEQPGAQCGRSGVSRESQRESRKVMGQEHLASEPPVRILSRGMRCRWRVWT